MNLGSPAVAVTARELARLVIEGLNLEGVNAEQTDLSAPMFGGGLDLDSLDMLEISLLVQQRFGVKLRADDPDNEAHFSSLQSLADHISSILCTKT